jgi:magnesium transporter
VKSERLLEDLFALRHDLQTIRTSAAQAHQSYSNLLETAAAQDGLLTVDVRRVTELRQGFWHVMQTTDLEREYLQEMLDLFQTRVATELNRFVRRVTAWGTVGIAWTVIVGVYGMNFVAIPGLEAPWGFSAVLVGMAVVAVVLAVFFHRHGWL